MSVKKPVSLAVALGFVASLACAPVLAQEEGQQLPEGEQPKALEEIEFGEIDQDGDGKVTRDEYVVHGSAEDFQAADTDGDGMLTQEEFDSAKQPEEQPEEQRKE